MPKLVLLVSAKLKNISLLEPDGGTNDESMNYFMKLECEQCGWLSTEVCVSLGVREEVQLPHGRRCHVNLQPMCHGCERRGTITLVPGFGRPLDGNNSEDVPLMVFDCDGLLPVEYSFNGGWSATTVSGKRIYVNLVSGEFIDKIDGEALRIKDLRARFESFCGH